MNLLPDHVVAEAFTVRCYGAGDAPALVDAVTRSLEHLRPWMPWIRFEPQTVEQRRAWIAEVNAERASGGSAVYGIFEGDDLVGGTGLHRRSTPDTLEIGYWVRVDATGRKVASTATWALTATALYLAGVTTVEICHDRRNHASRSVPERLGYRLVEEYRRAPEAPGESGLICRWRHGAAPTISAGAPLA